MRISLKPCAYSGVVLRLDRLDAEGFHYEIRLAHRDPEFGVVLAACTDETEARVAWNSWARYFELPTLVERIEGVIEAERPLSGVGAGARRRGRGASVRRARFLTRRKPGRPELSIPVGTCRELSGGWRPEA